MTLVKICGADPRPRTSTPPSRPAPTWSASSSSPWSPRAVDADAAAPAARAGAGRHRDRRRVRRRGPRPRGRGAGDARARPRAAARLGAAARSSSASASAPSRPTGCRTTARWCGSTVLLDRALRLRADATPSCAEHWAAARQRGRAPARAAGRRARRPRTSPTPCAPRGPGRSTPSAAPRRRPASRITTGCARSAHAAREASMTTIETPPVDAPARRARPLRRFGGRFVPETVMAALDELEAAVEEALADPAFHAERDAADGRDYCGRPTPLYLAERLTEDVGGAQIWLKREDLDAHRRAQDQQRARPGADRPAARQAAHRRRDRRRPARRRHGHACARASGSRRSSTWARRTPAASAPTSCACTCWAPR